MTTTISDWQEVLQWEKQISTSSCDWGISWSLSQKTLVEKKIYHQKEDEKFPQIEYVNFKIEEFIYLIVVMNSVLDKVITNQAIGNVL